MKIQFLKDTAMAKLPKMDNCIVVYKEGYSLPSIANAEYIEFQKYKACYLDKPTDNIVLVGLNRMLNPQNRCELIFEYLQTMTNHITKYSIDTNPFIGEPWRFWFHYSVAFNSFLNINYSYAIETEWQHWFYRRRDDCLISPNSLTGKIIETYSDLQKLNSEFVFYKPDTFLTNYYNEVKNIAFEKYNNPKQIIQYMTKQLNHRLGLSFGYDSYRENKEFNLPDFGVYRFLTEENQRRQDIYNLLVGVK